MSMRDHHFWTADIKQVGFAWQSDVVTSLGGTDFDITPLTVLS
jgi:hypothetical protein